MEDMHEKLKKAREAKGLSQYEISDLLDIKQPTWNKYETGKSGMSAETLYNICKTLNISSDWVLGLLEDDTTDRTTQFYDKIIDLICDYGAEGSVKDEVVDEFINDVNEIYICFTEEE